MALAVILSMRRCSLLQIIFTWLLLVPPNTYNTTWRTGNIIDTERPLKEWILIGEFDTKKECEETMMQNKLVTALTGNADMAERFNLGECIQK